MRLSYAKVLWMAGSVFTVGCLLCGAVNFFYHHYTLTPFFPWRDALFIIMLPCFIAYGLETYAENTTHFSQTLKTGAVGVGCFLLLIMGASFIQLTPFHPIDNYLIRGDKFFFIQVNHYTAYLEKHTLLKNILKVIYDSLDLEMIGAALYVLIQRRFALLYEYYSLLFITAVIGFSLYYFFPTVAPATAMGGIGFDPCQYATGIKFYELHHHLFPSTHEGGLIAFPSFHVIWGFLLTYMLRFSPVLFILLLIYNVGLALSCVALGWHYGLDIIGSALVLALSYKIYKGLIHDTADKARY